MRLKQKSRIHDGVCWSVAWDPTGVRLVSTGEDRRIKLLRQADMSVETITEASESSAKHTRTIRRVSWRGDSRMIAACSFDSTISLWNVSHSDTVRFVTQLSGQENEVKGVCFSACGEQLATCSRDKSIWIFDVSGFLRRSSVSESAGFQEVQSGKAVEDGEFVFPASPSMVVRGDEVECLAILQGHTQDVKSVKFSPHDSHMLVSVSYDDSIKIWRSTSSDDWELSETLRGHIGTVWDVSFNPESTSEFATVSADGTMKIWSNQPPSNPISASKSYLLSGPLGVSSRHHRTSTSFSPVSESWSCQTIQLTSSQIDGIPPPAIHSVDWTRQGLIATACGDNTIRLFLRKGLTNIPISTVKTDSEPNCVSFNPKENLLAVAFDDGSVGIYEIEDYDFLMSV